MLKAIVCGPAAAALASRIACRSESMPLSAVLRTVKMEAGDGLPRVGTRAVRASAMAAVAHRRERRVVRCPPGGELSLAEPFGRPAFKFVPLPMS